MRVKICMEMRTAICALVLIAIVSVSQGNRNCSDTERESLLLFKQGVVDGSGMFSSWSGDNCCLWGGVYCSSSDVFSIGLSLQYNDIQWINGIPKSLENLCTLNSLELVNVGLRQDISDILDILSGCIADGLVCLDLSENQLYGHLTDKLVGRFKNLDRLDLRNNSISGGVPASLGELPFLRVLTLSYNKLNGTLPRFHGQPSMLELIDFSSNLLEDVISEIYFLNLNKLVIFECSWNPNLVLKVGHDWVPPFKLEDLRLSSWNLGPGFPQWLRNQTSLQVLDLSNTGISDTIPDWFWYSLQQIWHLNFSQNQISGQLSDMLPDTFYKYATIDMSSNNFRGELPPFLSHKLLSLDLSNNSFSGSISPFLCQKLSNDGVAAELRVLVLNFGDNYFSGEIPDCWARLQNLVALRLDHNNFTGNLPSSMGNLVSLKSLHLRYNHLDGKLPMSLENCTQLLTLDAGENNFVGSIPSFFGTRLSNLSILSLRSNKFEGHIPKELCSLTSLQILDLADNKLYGRIPKCIGNLSAMATKESSFHYDNSITSMINFFDDLLLVVKGRVDGYSTILKFVNIIDLSQNALSDDIPEEVTSLHELYSLNLSHNSLTGTIPEDIGALQSVESLDFSTNRLSGRIPQSISSLTFLSHLNLSHNNLSGVIPLGTQIQGFNSSSFTDNPGLCGPPLNNCTQKPSADEEDEDDSDFKREIYITVTVGFITSFWGFCGCFLLKRTWRIAYFRFLDDVRDRIYVVVILKVRSLRAKLL